MTAKAADAKKSKKKRLRKNSVANPSQLKFERRYLVLVGAVLHLLQHKPTPAEEQQLSQQGGAWW